MKTQQLLLLPVTLIGMFALISWEYNPNWMYSLSDVAVNPFTALILLTLCATTLVKYPVNRLMLMPAIAFLVLIVADFFTEEINLNLDQSLWSDRIGSNHMAPNTAMCLLLLCVNASYPRYGFLLPLSAFAMASIAIYGYFDNNYLLYQIGYFTPMAILTAISVICICCYQLLNFKKVSGS